MKRALITGITGQDGSYLAEFLLEQQFPWHLVERIGVTNRLIYQQVVNALPARGHRPQVEIRPDWYY